MDHPDVVWNGSTAPIQQALACPTPESLGTALGYTAGTLFLLLSPVKGVVALRAGDAAADVAGASSTLSDLVEANAQRRLAEMETNNPGAHFLSRHGAQTTIEDQYTRATTGDTPDGYSGPKYKPVNSSRFFSYQIELNAIQRAQTIASQTGATKVITDMGYPVGEGFVKGGSEYRTTTNVLVVFKNGKPYTAYPYLDPLP